MESEVEFHDDLNEKVKETIRWYSKSETDFMACNDFFRTEPNISFRRKAVSTIAVLWRRYCAKAFVPNLDTYVPYLAMNYFDRYLSRNYKAIEVMEGGGIAEKLELISISCLYIAGNIRNIHISTHIVIPRPNMVMKMVNDIQRVLNIEERWQLNSITAFTFLDYYYPYFKPIGVFKHRCLNEIIVQAQGEHEFADYRPSIIAFAAFMAACKRAYPSKHDEIEHALRLSEIGPRAQVEECANMLFILCDEKQIKIEPSETKDVTEKAVKARIPSTSGKGKAVMEEGGDKKHNTIEASETEDVVTEDVKARIPSTPEKTNAKREAGSLLGVDVDQKFLELVAPKPETMKFGLKWISRERKLVQPASIGCSSCIIL